MVKAKTGARAASEGKAARPVEARVFAGTEIHANPAAIMYMVHRFPGPGGGKKAKGEACGLDVKDAGAGAWKRIDRFPITAADDGGPWGPSWRRVLETWGSGTYRFQWFREAGGKLCSLGFGSPETFNDPAHPQLPAYRRVGGADGQKPAPQPAAAPAAAPTDLGSTIAAAAKDGKIDVPIALLLVQLVQAQATTAETMFHGWMEQERQRRQELESDYDRKRQRDAEWARQENERTASFWAAQTRAARELTRAPAGDDGGTEDRFADLAESIEALATTVQTGQSENTVLFREAMQMFGPALAQRFIGPANGQPGALPEK